MTVDCTPHQVRRCPSLVINLAWRARCCLPRAVPLSGRSIGPRRYYCFETSRCRHALQQVPRLDRSRWVGSTHTGAACKCSPRRLASLPTGGWAQPDAQLGPDGWTRVVRGATERPRGATELPRGATELPRGATERPEPPRARAAPDTARRALRRRQGGRVGRRVGRHHGRRRRVRAPGARHGARHDEDPRSRQEHGGPSRVVERRRERGCARQRRRRHRQGQGWGLESRPRRSARVTPPCLGRWLLWRRRAVGGC
jgi:hypothetical protein